MTSKLDALHEAARTLKTDEAWARYWAALARLQQRLGYVPVEREAAA